MRVGGMLEGEGESRVSWDKGEMVEIRTGSDSE
jgi:hypothetical protein